MHGFTVLPTRKRRHKEIFTRLWGWSVIPNDIIKTKKHFQVVAWSFLIPSDVMSYALSNASTVAQESMPSSNHSCICLPGSSTVPGTTSTWICLCRSSWEPSLSFLRKSYYTLCIPTYPRTTLDGTPTQALWYKNSTLLFTNYQIHEVYSGTCELTTAVWISQTMFYNISQQIVLMCKFSKVSMEYFVACNYFWLLVEAIFLHTLLFTAVLTKRRLLKKYMLLGWGKMWTNGFVCLFMYGCWA